MTEKSAWIVPREPNYEPTIRIAAAAAAGVETGAYPDADPDQVAAAAVGGMNFTWCGQSCGSTSRAFVHASIYQAVLEQIKARVAAFRPGIATDPATTMGAIGSRSQFERVLGYIEIARNEGARLLCGGGRPSDPQLANGFFVEPTVFFDVTPEMRISRVKMTSAGTSFSRLARP